MNEYMNLRDVIAYTTLSKATLYLLMQKGRFPRGIKILENRVVWRTADVQSWMKSKAEEVTA